MVNKLDILRNICYTELVYWRINKKLETTLSKEDIEIFLYKILEKTGENLFLKKWKNFYITNIQNNIKITINSNTFRVITVDRLNK